MQWLMFKIELLYCITPAQYIQITFITEAFGNETGRLNYGSRVQHGHSFCSGNYKCQYYQINKFVAFKKKKKKVSLICAGL